MIEMHEKKDCHIMADYEVIERCEEELQWQKKLYQRIL